MRGLECLPCWLLLVSTSRCCYEIGALADEARKNEVAEDRGDSNMIQAQGEW